MKQVITTEKYPIKLWLDEIEDSALNQAKNIANLPFVHKHVALMPDAHMGYGMPIGGVLATKGVVIPNAVGVDIGCGMCAIKTSLTIHDFTKEIYQNIFDLIKKNIPVGFAKHSTPNNQAHMPDMSELYKIFGPEGIKDSIVNQEIDNANLQLGTLGGGNHFIELQKDTVGNIWIMIHSGSRNLGKKVADYYNKLAIEHNQLWHTQVEKEKQLAFLPLDTEYGKRYLAEMDYCVNFAFGNRYVMMSRIIAILADIFDMNMLNIANPDKLINIAHNYAALENHKGSNVVVHRKGATSARKDEIGIIPGSQGTSSYIVKGLGNPESFESCSHGAGRVMGRKQAQKELNLKEEQARLNDQGIIHGINSEKDLDEAPGAYKDIDQVMKNQSDLVEILTELKPILAVKG